MKYNQTSNTAERSVKSLTSSSSRESYLDIEAVVITIHDTTRLCLLMPSYMDRGTLASVNSMNSVTYLEICNAELQSVHIQNFGPKKKMLMLMHLKHV